MDTTVKPERNYLAVAVPLLLFGLSLAAPAISTAGRNVPGIQLLIWGWIGPVFGSFGWYANPFALIAVWRRLNTAKQDNAPAIFSWVALLISMDAFRLSKYPLNEGGATPVGAFEAGFYLWIASIVVNAVINTFLSFRKSD